MKRYVITILLLNLSVFLFSQQKTFTISGYVYDKSSGESLISAAIISDTKGVVSNEFGFYSLTLDKVHSLPLIIEYSYLGYESQKIELYNLKDTLINVYLNAGESLKASSVEARKEAGISSVRAGSIEVPITIIKNTPTLFGEADILKTLQLMPGVQQGVSGFSGIHVRGGGPDENLLLLDGVPIYSAQHILGIFSVFQPEAVKKVTLYKGAFPARYGGRVSSIVDIRSNDGNLKKYSGLISLGLLTSKLHIEGPIIKDRTSFSLSARALHTYLFTPFLKDKIGNFYFYDFNAKLSHKISNRDRLFFNIYKGRDTFIYKNEDQDQNMNIDFSWGNLVSALRWNHVFNNKLFANFTISHSAFNLILDNKVLQKNEAGNSEEGISFVYKSGVKDFDFKFDFDYNDTGLKNLKFGANYTRHRFSPEVASLVQLFRVNGENKDKSFNVISNTDIYSNEFAMYAENNINIGNFTLNPGLRTSMITVHQSNYFSVEPRLAMRYQMGNFSTKLSYSRMSQAFHLLSSSSFSLPTDLWVPVTNSIKPEYVDQISAGIYYNTLSAWEFSVEAYYKQMKNVLAYKDGKSFFGISSDWENSVSTGNGRAYGLEIYIEKTKGRTTGWLAYTLAKSDRVFPDGTINYGRWFPYTYDRRHVLNIVVNHRFNDKFDVSATWQYTDGRKITYPAYQNLSLSGGQYAMIDYVESRNNFKMPASHMLNLSCNYHIKHRVGESILNLSVYNVYNNKTPHFIMTRPVRAQGEKSQKAVDYYTVTILPVLPTLSYTYKF